MNKSARERSKGARTVTNDKETRFWVRGEPAGPNVTEKVCGLRTKKSALDLTDPIETRKSSSRW